MLTFEEFKEQIDLIKAVHKNLDELNKLHFDIFDTDLINNCLRIFDNFIVSHFTEEGSDLVFWWLYEDVKKVLYETIAPDIFNGEPKKIEINIEKIEDLWAYMIKYKKVYFK
jgi:hypothetical protein